MSDELTLSEQDEALVERQDGKTYSRQPRFSDDRQATYLTLLRMVKLARDLKQPDYAADSRKRDAWLQQFWRQAPHLAGIINSVTGIDANRGWTLTGGRNQVYRYTDPLHNAEGGTGWRPFCRKESLSFWSTDMGSVTENGRDGQGGPLRAIYHVDPARCRLTGENETPLAYLPPSGKEQKWASGDFFRVTSMPSDDESFNGLGFCAVSRALEIVKLLYGVLMHDQEQVGARMPKGLLLLEGVTEDQWDQSLEVRDVSLDSKEREYYGGLHVLFDSGLGNMDAKLTSLSQLPAGFDGEKFTNMSMYGIALCFGYDPREFWPVSMGSLGTGRESEMQHVKASGKGGMDFVLGWAEGFQRQLPDTLEFGFEQRDDAGALLEAEVADAWAKVAERLYKAGIEVGASLLQRDQALSLLADHGIIPPEWSEIEEESQATDTEEARAREEALCSPYVQRAIARYPYEAIIRYHWPSGREQVLWERGDEALKRAVWPVTRQDDVLFQGDDVTITDADVTRAIQMGRERVGDEFGALLDAPTLTDEEIETLDES